MKERAVELNDQELMLNEQVAELKNREVNKTQHHNLTRAASH
jgi:hypothetical protein